MSKTVDEFWDTLLAEAAGLDGPDDDVAPCPPANTTPGLADQADVVASPKDPIPNARRFIRERYTSDGRELLLCERDDFYTWDEQRWRTVDRAELKAQLYTRFEGATYLKPGKDGFEEVPFQVNRYAVANLVEALEGLAFHAPLDAPCWIDGDGPIPASEVVPVSNGLLRVATRRLYAHTPKFFNVAVTPVDYDPKAPPPRRWLAFLAELWGGADDSIATLQEWLGYLLSGDTSQQKMLLVVGPKRSGKGTIARVAKQLLGSHNVAGCTLSSLATNFGLAPLVNAPAAFISDARLPLTGASVITERLLSVSGEDTLTVDRKYREAWTGKLPTRFVVFSNELPRLADTSGAIASRFIVVTMSQSFYGRENPALTDELLVELPSILNWALDGLDRLRARGRFAQPASGAEAIRELEDLSSPVGAFVRDHCLTQPGVRTRTDQLYEAWRKWCAEHGRDRPGTAQTFGRDLRTVLPALRVTQPRENGVQFRYYEGIALDNENM